jgi:hypothetical protein
LRMCFSLVRALAAYGGVGYRDRRMYAHNLFSANAAAGREHFRGRLQGFTQ